MSQVARDVLLREMGLTPIWRTRGSSSGTAEVHHDEVATAISETETTLALQQTARVTPFSDTPHEMSAADPKARAAHIATLEWDALNAEIANCTACKLCKTRTNTVPGIGNRSPEWMVVGEAPGENDDKQGEPFVGRAGQLLDNMLAAIEKSRQRDVFIANVVKCRPPGNRDPEPDEIAACAPFLERQITLATPKLFIALGKFAAQQLLQTDATVDAMRGSGGKRGDIPVVVTYHPAYLLRSPSEKAKAWEDLVKAKRIAGPSKDT